MSTPKITLKITRADGHSSEVATTRTAPPTPAMLAAAEALLEFLSTGAAPPVADADDSDDDAGEPTPMLFWSPDAPPHAFVRTDIPDERRQALAAVLKHGRVDTQYRGLAACRVCQRMLGSADLIAYDMIYPQGAEHYITVHGVWTPACDELLRRAASAP